MKTPAAVIATNIAELLASPSGSNQRRGFVLTNTEGGEAGDWGFLPDSSAVDNGTTVRRPVDRQSGELGRWFKL